MVNVSTINANLVREFMHAGTVTVSCVSDLGTKYQVVVERPRQEPREIRLVFSVKPNISTRAVYSRARHMALKAMTR